MQVVGAKEKSGGKEDVEVSIKEDQMEKESGKSHEHRKE